MNVPDQPPASDETPATPASEAQSSPDAPSTETPVVAAAESTSIEQAPEPAQPKGQLDPKGGGYFWGTGRRKASVARVRIRPGTGKFLINKREIEKYFFGVRGREDVVAPLKATKTVGKYDVFVNAGGGGQTGQAGAVMLGLARALKKADPDLEPALREGNFLTRDPRKVERQKPGQPGARKRFQFSKR